MKIAISGITGQLGRLVLTDLLEEGMTPANLIGLARTPSKAQDFADLGIDVRPADLNDYESLLTALHGVDRALLVSTNEPDNQKRFIQHQNFIKAATANHLSLLVYTSGVNPEHNPLGTAHLATENYLKKSGINYIILRNARYLETKQFDIINASQCKTIYNSTGEAKFGLALRSDYAEAAAKVLNGNFKTNQTYNLSDNLVSYADFTKVLSSVFNQEVKVQDITSAQFAELLVKMGRPEPVAKVLAASNEAERNGVADVKSDDFKQILGRPVAPLTTAIRRLI